MGPYYYSFSFMGAGIDWSCPGRTYQYFAYYRTYPGNHLVSAKGERQKIKASELLFSVVKIKYEGRYNMSKKVLKITTHLRAIPEWLKINNSISIKLPLKSAKELAQKLLEVEDDVEIMINFASGKEAGVEIKFEDKPEE